MNGLGPLERRETRQYIVGQFFSQVGDKQVRDLDELMKIFDTQAFNYKGISYHNSKINPSPFYRPLDDKHHAAMDKYLRIYSGLEMEMASLSSLLTRLFRKCNSYMDMSEVLPKLLLPFSRGMEVNSQSDDYLVAYLTDKDIAQLHVENKDSILQIKVRLMRDEVFK